MTSVAEVLKTIETFATVEVGNPSPDRFRNPAVVPITHAQIEAQRAPFAELLSAIDPELIAELDTEQAAAAEKDIREIIAERLTEARARVERSTRAARTVDWSDHCSVAEHAATAMMCSADLRFVQALDRP